MIYAGDNEAKLMTKLAPEWVRTKDPVIRSPARYRWTMAPAKCDRRTDRWTNGGALQYLPSRAFGAAGDKKD